MTDPEHSQTPDLADQVERLRLEGLRQAQAWDDERREALRLRSISERYRAQADDLSAALVELNSHYELAAGKVQYLGRRLEDQEQRGDQLIAALEEFGQHARRCKYKPKKTDSACTCGLRDAIQGIEGASSSEEAEPTNGQ